MTPAADGPTASRLNTQGAPGFGRALRSPLLDDAGDDAGTDGAAALTDGEAKLLLHRHRDVVAGHHHLRPLRQRHHTRHVRRPEVELRPVIRKERRVTPALVL